MYKESRSKTIQTLGSEADITAGLNILDLDPIFALEIETISMFGQIVILWTGIRGGLFLLV